MAVATSGDTERFVEIDGTRYSHIVDPRTGLGLTHSARVTVITGLAAQVAEQERTIRSHDEDAAQLPGIALNAGLSGLTGARIDLTVTLPPDTEIEDGANESIGLGGSSVGRSVVELKNRFRESTWHKAGDNSCQLTFARLLQFVDRRLVVCAVPGYRN